MEIKTEVLNAALAGLLHDVGKFAQRAGERGSDFATQFVPRPLQESLAAATPGRRAAQANVWLANAQTGRETQADAAARLTPALSRVDLKKSAPQELLYNRLAMLSLDGDRFYPVSQAQAVQDRYPPLWAGFIAEMQDWKARLGPQWETQSPYAFYVTLLALLRKYLWCVPAASPGETAGAWEEVSLYNHLRLASALAACLAADGAESVPAGQPAALMLRGDVSGIQSFIFRIARPAAETEHVARRLRGRSFYVSLLVEVAVDWLLRSLGLPPNCALFVGGGRFDLLLPVKAREQLSDLIRALETWLLDSFQGELGIQTATCDLRPGDFGDMRWAYQALEADLAQSKQQKWIHHFAKPEFFQPDVRLWHVCTVCQLTPLPDPGVCPSCRQHADIGKHLPHAVYLAYIYGESALDLPEEQVIRFPGAPFRARVAILRPEDSLQPVAAYHGEKVLQKLNETEGFILSGQPSSFRFLANAAPKATRYLKIGANPVEKGDVLHFEAIAGLSGGASRLGVLKADVDLLGLVMSEGLENPAQNLHPTISRIAALSDSLDLFFAGLINRVCAQTFESWRDQRQKADPEANNLAAVDGAFYVVYAGGDDLFIVGPWDGTLALAERINGELARFCGGNPNLTLSAGYVQVKPRYPVQKFAELVDQAEKDAKEAGRERISAFGQVMEWNGKPDSFSGLMQFSGRLVAEIETRHVHRTLVSDLGRLHRQHTDTRRKTLNPMWTPRLYYTLARRLDQQAFEQIGGDLISAMRGGKILFPVSVVSLATRKE